MIYCLWSGTSLLIAGTDRKAVAAEAGRILLRSLYVEFRSVLNGKAAAGGNILFKGCVHDLLIAEKVSATLTLARKDGGEFSVSNGPCRDLAFTTVEGLYAYISNRDNGIDHQFVVHYSQPPFPGCGQIGTMGVRAFAIHMAERTFGLPVG